MATSLETSRGFLSNAVARVRAGISESDRQQGYQGPDIKVEPFDAVNVSTPAALIKLGTAVAAARRDKANYAAGLENAALLRERTRAEIAHLRAEADYNLGLGRQTGTPGQSVMGQGPYKGWTRPEALADLADRRLRMQAANGRATADRAAARAKYHDDLANARAGLAETDKRVERETDAAALKAYEKDTDPLFQRVVMAGRMARPEDLAALELSPTEWKTAFSMGGATSPQVQSLIARAKTNAMAKLRAHAKFNVDRFYEGRRKQYQDIIDRPFEDANPEAPAADDPSFDELIRSIQDAGN